MEKKRAKSGARFSQEQLDAMLLGNPALKISKRGVAPQAKQAMDYLRDDKKAPKKKYNIVDVKGVKEANATAKARVSYDENHVAVLWQGARLLSVNQIFALLQLGKRKYELFAYKKLWHTMVKEALLHHKDTPFFDKGARIFLFLRANRRVDVDAQAVMFKFLIDALKPSGTEDARPWRGILPDDNYDALKSITPIHMQGDYAVGLRVERQEESDDSLLHLFDHLDKD